MRVLWRNSGILGGRREARKTGSAEGRWKVEVEVEGEEEVAVWAERDRKTKRG
jgi:hypothetical protein